MSNRSSSLAPSGSVVGDYVRADQDRAVEVAYEAIKTLTWGSSALVCFSLWHGHLPGVALGTCYLASCLLASTLHHLNYYTVGRLFIYIASTSIVVFEIVHYGPHSWAFFILLPLAFASLSGFQSRKLRYGLFAGVCLLAVGYFVFVDRLEAGISVADQRVHAPFFLLLAGGMTAFLVEQFLRANRNFRLRSQRLTSRIRDRTERLERDGVLLREQAERLECANTELARRVERGILVERQLRGSNEELEQFAYAASHDLKEPLRSISSFVQLIRRRLAEEQDEELEEYFNFVVSGAGRMTQLLDDLLIYSRIGRTEEVFERVALADIATVLGYGHRSALAKIGGTLTFEPLPEVYGSRKGIRRILDQLIVNAVRFHDPTRPLEVRVRASVASDRQARITVSDNGIGIPPEYHERVFQLFQRLHGREEYEGSGIGLALVRKLVGCAGGEIEILPTDGSGTTVAFTLPTQAPPSAS